MGLKRIYLDFNASTPIAPEVVSAMAGILDAPLGNPSSDHWAKARARCRGEGEGPGCGLLGAEPGEVVFTSGGSESNNHALKGVFFAKAGAHPAHHHYPRWSTRRS